MRAAPISWSIFPLGYGPSTIALSANNTTPNGCSVTFAHAGADNRILVNVTTPLPVLTYGHFGVFGAVAQNDDTFLGNSSSSGTRFILEFSHAIDGADVTLTGMTEADFDGPAGVHYNALVGRVIQKWRWDYGDGTTEDSTVNPTLHEYDDEGTYTISFIPIDQHGLIGDPVFTVNVDAEAGGRTSTLFDPQGTFYTAVKDGSDLKINRYSNPRASSSKETIATFAGYKNGSLSQNGMIGEGGPMFLMAQSGAGNWELKTADDSGEGWDDVSQPFDSDYKNANKTGTLEGFLVAAAIRKSDSALIVRRSGDSGATWPEEFEHDVLSGAKALSIRQEKETGSTRIVITDDVTFLYESYDLGETSAPVPV